MHYYVSPSGMFYDTAATLVARLAINALTWAPESLKNIKPE